MSLCSKPSCARPGSAILAYDYAARIAVLEDPLEGEVSPHNYALCGPCANQLRPPRGWELVDLRTAPRLFVPQRPDQEGAAERRAAWG
ncbi:MAG TPA: DUF3499 family protein [Actinomycetota bacterium]|nr:DUF3499 family protein [Actinomycetota bacterium]